MRIRGKVRTGRTARTGNRALSRNLAIAGTGLLIVAGCGLGDDEQARTAGGHATLDQRSPSPSPTPPPPRNIDCGKAKCVALTFDDGPGAHTARLLDTLKKNGARATFFMLGENVGAHRDIVRRMALEGQEVANHSWSHPDLTGLSAEGVRSQIRRTQQAIKDASGVEPKLMRPPYGATNEQVGRAAGMPLILWSVDTLDWRHRNVARDVRVGTTEPQNGGIVLFHDVHKTSVDAMPKVIGGLKKRGFTLVTVSELFRGQTLEPGEKYLERHPPASPVTVSPSGNPTGSASPAPSPS